MMNRWYICISFRCVLVQVALTNKIDDTRSPSEDLRCLISTLSRTKGQTRGQVGRIPEPRPQYNHPTNARVSFIYQVPPEAAAHPVSGPGHPSRQQP